MKDVEIIGLLKTYIQQTLVGMGALKGAPCEVQGTQDEGDGTQTLTLKWKDSDGVVHTTDISLPAAIFNIVNPSNGQTLKYNDTSGKFENSNVSFSADLEDLDNVVITSVQDGQVLTYDATNNRWINSNGSTVATLSDLTDVNISTLQNGQIISYNSVSQKWVNVTLYIDDLGNVSITNASDGQILTYNGTSGKWENKALDLDAADIGYNGTTSGLSATDTQAAIDELADEKVDKETGKGLSTNDYTNEAKAIVDGVTDELAKKVDKETGKGLSTNDFTTALKDKLDGIESGAEANVIETVKINGNALTPTDKAVNIQMGLGDLTNVDLQNLADGMILIYDANTQKFVVAAQSGGTYTAGDGIEIDQNNKISSKIVLFTGTEAQWNALSLADKIKFTHYATNDDQTGQIDPTPTQNSSNLMTSGGIWTALQGLIAKVTGATANNFAALDASGNVIDSGKAASDFAQKTASNTLTGQQVIQANEIVIQSTNIDKDTAPQASTDGNAYIPFSDEDGDAFAVVYSNQRTDGAIDLHIDTFTNNNPSGKVIVNGKDVKTLMDKIGGEALYSWLDIPKAVSSSGKMTRIFTSDDHLFVGSQVWSSSGVLEKEGKFYFQPTPTQITLLNGVTSSEPGNCNVFDFGAFTIVNLAGLVIPSPWTGGTPICQIPKTATARLNFRVPTTSAGGEIIYIDANSKDLKLTGVVDIPIYTNIIIPTFSS